MNLRKLAVRIEVIQLKHLEQHVTNSTDSLLGRVLFFTLLF